MHQAAPFVQARTGLCSPRRSVGGSGRPKDLCRWLDGSHFGPIAHNKIRTLDAELGG